MGSQNYNYGATFRVSIKKSQPKLADIRTAIVSCLTIENQCSNIMIYYVNGPKMIKDGHYGR